jgi:predicted RNase H-like nuclease
VYPHPALLALLHLDYRVPYKVSRAGKYWKGASVAERISRLLTEFREIHAALTSIFGELPVALPSPEEVMSLSVLKRYEDALDALVCAWVGVRFAQGGAAAYGDEVAAIWVPEPPLPRHRPTVPEASPLAPEGVPEKPSFVQEEGKTPTLPEW